MDGDAEWNKWVRYMVYQYEIAPNTRRVHVQGYIELTNACRMAKMKTLLSCPKVHLEARMGTREQARAYCMKEDSRDPEGGGPYEWGTWNGKGAGNRSDLTSAIQVMKEGGLVEVANKHPEVFVRAHRGLRELDYVLRQKEAQSTLREVKVIVLYGVPGAGKSQLTWSLAQSLGQSFYYVTPPSKGGPVWFNGYEGQKTLVMDDFSDWMDYQMLLRLLDKFPYQVQAKGSMVWAQWTTVIFTSMDHWKKWYRGSLYQGMMDPRALERRIHGTFRLLKRETPSGNIMRVAQTWTHGDDEDQGYDSGVDVDAISAILKIIGSSAQQQQQQQQQNDDVVIQEREELIAPPPSPDIFDLTAVLSQDSQDPYAVPPTQPYVSDDD
jgi:hypothetical protein